jgi:signal transduction histidine kinase/ligand-binding sensor domain-containing protein/DNA-binding response OmpR family regulator
MSKLRIIHFRRIIFAALLVANFNVPSILHSAEILRFEHFNTTRGLSQNTVSSILCDSNGFLWIGTNNGLNRYDGNKFRVFMNEADGKLNFTHNRITKIWEDERGFIWFETHDGHYHYFNPITETFETLSRFFTGNNEGISIFSDFLQYSKDEIWLGIKGRGIIRLLYHEDTGIYETSHYTARGVRSISNDHVTFLRKDDDDNIWIGTARGITLLEKENISSKTPQFQHIFIDHSFTTFLETATELWFGTEDAGILKFQKFSQLYTYNNKRNTPSIQSNHITSLYKSKTGNILATFFNQGLQSFSQRQDIWQTIQLTGNQVEEIFEDRFENIWVTTEQFGVTRINPESRSTKHFHFFDATKTNSPDHERHVFFEDSNDNLWIGTHEGALNLYDRTNDRFVFYRNNPNDPNSISSNIVHAIIEDHSGQLWVGTGQFQGGLERIVLKEPAIEHLLPTPVSKHISDNIVRSVFEDQSGRLWLGTKAGKLHVFENNRQIHAFDNFRTPNENVTGVNIYSITMDDKGFLWLGSKGKGMFVTHQPLKSYSNVKDISFLNYQPIAGDSTSLSHTNVYSITKDLEGNMWIGTYANGLNRVVNNHDGSRSFIRITTENSNLSSNFVRNILADSKGRLWIATGYGLNLLERISPPNEPPRFRSFFSGHDQSSISLNDVIHLFEDSKGQIWAATFGGGVNRLVDLTSSQATFEKYTQLNGLSNNVVYGILEDNAGHLWFSTENGLSRLNHNNVTFEVFNSNNGLNFDSFSENTCLKSANGKLLFGGFRGLELVDTEKIMLPGWGNKVVLTDFQLFNLEVPIGAGSPLTKSITYTEQITLRHFQSSFSFEFSALDYLDPEKTQYAYKLDNFDDNWNYITSERKATYTNLSAGEYVFRVKATNRGGEWMTDATTLSITILPPWYKTKWAFLLYSLAIVILIFIVFSTISKINQYRNELKIERRVNEMKLRFFTNISHEIRTPLTLIIGPIEDLLNKVSLDNSDKPKLEIIRRNGKRMLHLTNQLLDFRKVQNNKMNLKLGEFDIVNFTKNIHESFIPLANHKGINYKFSSTVDSFYVWADPSKLDMVIYNLISNALKFTDSGKEVALTIRESNTEYNLEIIVTDQGRGIAPENLSQLFERFTILSGEELAGTGIGLSLANELAKLHHAEIAVESVFGKGSTFTLKLREGKEHFSNDERIVWSDFSNNDFVNSETAEIPLDQVQLDDEESDTPPISEKPFVLVVEDNHEIGNYICQTLSPEYLSCLADNGEVALNMLATQNPDLIISDVMMPVMDGMEMTRQIKDNFSTSHIPIILLTSKSDINDQISGLETGADAYITKPFNSEYLKAVAKNLIEQRKNIITKFRDNKTIDQATLKINSKDKEFLEKLVAFVEENISEDFTIEMLADKLFVSRTVFYNKVKGLTGLSPVEFVRQIKLKIAAHLLTQGYNVSEAALKVGFSDARYFSRQFKTLFGHLPSKHVEKNS